MPEQTKVVVTNTTPLIALTAATGSLEILRAIYAKVVVPYEVAQEIKAGGKELFGLDIFQQSAWLAIHEYHNAPNA
jgi:predicted nucleic acid-binding protein